jgi:hypothetical protein
MTCQELLELVLDYHGGELVVTQRETVEIHVAACEQCAILIHSYTHTVRVARALPKCDSLPAALEARLRKALEPHLGTGEST